MPKGMSYGSVDKEQIARVKKVLRKLGLGHIIPKVKNNTVFYRSLTQTIMTYELGQAHGEIPPHTMNELKKQFKYYKRQPVFNFGMPGGSPLSVADYLSVCGSLTLAKHSLKPESIIYEHVNAICEVLTALVDYFLLTIHTYMVRMLLPNSNLAGIGFLTLNMESGRNIDGQMMRKRMMVSLYKPKRKSFSVKGDKRTGYEVIFHPQNQYGFLQLTAQSDGEEMFCYITGHCLQRIRERYDICDDWISREIVFYAAHNSDLISYKGNLLLPVDSERGRVGYFVCHREENVVLLITFLLVTHNGTPEGDTLAKEIQLEYGDIKTLSLDHFGSFQKENIDDFTSSLLGKSNLFYLLKLNPKTVPQPPYLDCTLKNPNDELMSLTHTMTN